MIYTAGQQVRIMHSGAVGRVFLELPLREVYLVQFPGFPVVEKIYNGCDLEPLPDPIETWLNPPPNHHHPGA